MALELNFTITQEEDCDTVTFTETTGVDGNGYNSSTVEWNDVDYTHLRVTVPNGDTLLIQKGHTPNVDGTGSFDIVSTDLNYTSFPNGVYSYDYEVFTTDTSGVLVDNALYVIVSGTLTLNNGGSLITYQTGSLITWKASNVIETNTATFAKRTHIKTCNAFVYCNLRNCLRKLMLDRCQSDCDCKETIAENVAELVIDFNAAVLAFNEENYKCATETMERLEKICDGICNDCGC